MLFVARTPNGELQEVRWGSLFVTHLLTLNADEVDHHSVPGRPYSPGDVIEYKQQHSASALELWTDEDFARSHVYKVFEPLTNVPPGQRIKGYTFTDNGDEVGAIALFEPIPPPDQVPNHQLLMALSKVYFDKQKQTGYERLVDFLNSSVCPADVKIYWDRAPILERRHPKVQAVLRIEWCMDQGWIDQLFMDAEATS